MCSLGLLQLFLSWFVLPCQLLPWYSRLKSMSVTLKMLLAAVGFYLTPSSELMMFICAERNISIKKSEYLRISKHLPSGFVHPDSRFLCQKADIVWIEKEMLLLWNHVSLKVKYHKFIMGILFHRYKNSLSLMFYFSRILQETYCGGDFVFLGEHTFSLSHYQFQAMDQLFYD